MRALAMAVVAVIVSVTMGVAQEVNMGKRPFKVNVDKLTTYLELNPGQVNEVSDINDYFMVKQTESLHAKVAVRDKKMREAVYGNLKLMKKALTTDQYRKYVALINVTNNNNRMMNQFVFPDVYLADMK